MLQGWTAAIIGWSNDRKPTGLHGSRCIAAPDRLARHVASVRRGNATLASRVRALSWEKGEAMGNVRGWSISMAVVIAMGGTAMARAQTHRAPGRAASGRAVGGMPNNALGLCNDGTYVSTGSKQTACASHGGMKTWYLDGPEHATAADYAEPAPGRAASGRAVGGVPNNALGLCNDGTYVSTGSKQTACEAHGGMKTWYLDGTPNN
jgi:hypothetical protein